MRCVPVLLLLVLAAFVNAAAPPPMKPPHLDINGDPLPEGAVARLGTVRFRPHDPLDGQEIRWGYLTATALSPDGTTLAVAYEKNDGRRDMWIVFMNTATGKCVRKLELADFQDAGGRMRFTADGKGLFFSDWRGFRLIDPQSGKVRLSGASPVARGSYDPIAATADGKWLACQGGENVTHAPIVVWETKTGKKVMSLPGRGADCKELAYGPDGKRMLLWSHVFAYFFGFRVEYAVLACIDVRMRKIVGEETIHTAQFVALCPDSETVAIESANHRSVRIHHLPTGKDRCTILVKSSEFSFTEDGKVLLTIGKGGNAALWDARKGAKIRDLEGTVPSKDCEISGISKDGRTIAVLDGGPLSTASVVIWNATTGKRIGRPPGHEGTVTCIAYTPDGRMLVSGSVDKTVRLWDAATGKHLRLLSVHNEPITAIAVSPDGKLVACSSQTGVTRLSRVADGKTVTEFTGAEKGASALTFSHDGKRLFVGNRSPEVLAYDVASGKKAMRLETGNDGEIMGFGIGGALAVTANEKIRNGTTGPRLRLWDLTNQRPSASLMLENGRDKFGKPVASVRCGAASLSPDGRVLASSQETESAEGMVRYIYAQLRLWERGSGQPIRTLGPVITRLLAFSPDGRLLTATGERAGDNRRQLFGYVTGLDVWDTLTGKKVGTFPVTPECIAFSPDGTRIASGGKDHCVLIWEAPKPLQRVLAKAPLPAERDAWWAALGGEARAAYEVIGHLVAGPDYATKFLGERIRPVHAGDPDTVARLIAQLDGDEFAERERAERALAKMGEGIRHLLVKAIKSKTDLELRRRLGRLLEKCGPNAADARRHDRALLALEWIGTPAARSLLRKLADGAPGTQLTHEARAALQRLEQKP